METSAIDELYGDLDQQPRGYSDAVLNNDEDSVDIYSGLEDSPRNHGENGKSRAFSSPRRSKVSMDLYEELITKEQEEKEATYNELKSKFDAAQNHVQELLAKLQQMQTQNSSLHKENTLLKKNICALIKTARMEIIRKDDEITKLSKRSGQGIFHISGLDISPASSNHGLNSRRLQYPKGGLGLESSQHKDGGSVVNQLGQSTPNATQSHPVALRQCVRSNLNLENPLHCQNKDPGCMDSQSDSHSRDHRKSIDPTHSKERDNLRSSGCGRTCHSKEVDILEKPQTNMDKNESEKEQESLKESCTASKSQNQQHNGSVTTRSGRSRSPTFQTQHTSSSESSSHSSKLPSKVTEDTQHRKEKAQHNQAEKRQSGRTEVCGSRSGANSSTSEKGSSEKSGASLDRSMEKRWTREHHRKEERRHEDVFEECTRSSGKRCTKSDAIREGEVKKTRDGRNRHNGSSRDDKRSTRSEASKEPERQSAKKDDRGATDKAKEKQVPGYRDKGHGDVSENRRSEASVKPDLRKGHDKRKSSSRSEEQLYKSKSSKSQDGSRDSKRLCASADRSSVKEKYPVVDNEKGRVKSDKKSKNDARSSSKEKSKIYKHGNFTATCKKSPKRLTTSSGTSSGLEESSPKRKLSFMETLNLTLSPIKKQTKPDKAKAPLQPPPALETDSTEERVLFELGEEFCVVDETENSQQSIEAIDRPAAVTGVRLQLHPADADTQPSRGQDVTPASKGSPLLVNEKELELPKSLDGDTSDPPADKVCMDAEMKEMEPITKAGESCTTISQNSPDSQGVVDRTHLPPEGYEPIDSSSAPVADMCKEQNKEASVNEITFSKDSSKENQMDNKHEPTPSVQNDLPQQEVSTSVEVKASTKPCSDNTSVVLDGVSSTVTVDTDSHLENYSNTQAAASSDMGITNVILQENPDVLEPQAEAHSISPANIEEGVPPELTSCSEPDSTENQGKNIKPSTSVVPPDEDSMMRTLCSIKVIPEAISPLTSPVRQVKKGQQQYLGKEHHVKSLSKDFSSAITTNKDTTKMDMNKENERPDSSVMTSVQKDQKEALSSAGAEEELEEGEIISESDEEGALFIQSSPNKNRRLSSRIQSSPRTPRLEKTNQMKAAVTPDREQVKNLAAAKDSPTSSKRRFKTVTVPPKASISTAAEFLNMFSYIRSELRRKYMKLHKNVTKTAFRCIIDMSLASFTEFIDNVNFHKFCCQGTEIKPRLIKIISTVMSKLSSNGIVNRIFEQRADDLKQKLWNFVDGQFDFLFKEVKAALKLVTDVSTDKSLVNKSSVPKEDLELCKIQPKEPLSMAENRPHTMANIKVASEVQQKTIPSQTLPCKRRGLGSSGKDIKASIEDGTSVLDGQMCNQPTVVSSEKSQEPGYDSKTLQYVRRHSQNGSIQDRSDFEILTEQQASSLTFNLVTDSQMGDIFRCLLQGSDLLDATVSAGDNQSWPLNTPRKEGPPGESLMTPNKFITPSKVVTTWASISPCKFASPNSRFQMSVNPALLDENCLLEVPSSALAVQATSALTNPQQPYCILADDLAVSLTIPSPLKSDGHLSFLNPENGQPLSAPSAVITAHYSEDALLDGEDATEQDIHLSLDTDNSSCGSSMNGNQEAPNTALFLFKPDLHMQAEVMEKSNDHFILRIRHTSPEEPKHKHEEAPAESTVVCHEDKTSASHASLFSELPVVTQLLTTSNTIIEAQISNEDTSFVGVVGGVSPANLPKTTGSPAEQTATETHASHGLPAIVGTSASESEDASETQSTCHRRTRKRKKHRSGPKVKRNRREKSQENHDKKKHKKRSKSSKEKCEKTPAKKSPSPQLSPNSLSAHNVVRKKGAVVVTWTREEDRNILVELKMKGASAKTFAALSTKLRKSPAQIEERFSQLLKLFKKKEKMEG